MLEDHLRFVELVADNDDGGGTGTGGARRTTTGLPAVRPTRVGRSCVTVVPSSSQQLGQGLIIVATQHDLQVCQIVGGTKPSLHVRSTMSLGGVPVARMAASAAARQMVLIAAAVDDGSLGCYNVQQQESPALYERWRVPQAPAQIMPPAAATSSGRPQHAVSDVVIVGGEHVIVVDDMNGARCFQTDRGTPVVVPPEWQAASCVACMNASTVLMGVQDQVYVYMRSNDETYVYRGPLSPLKDSDIDADNDNAPAWITSSLHVVNATTLLVGFRRVIIDDDAQEHDEDDDDPHQHEARLVCIELDRSTTNIMVQTGVTDLGDVVPFFAVPRHGRPDYLVATVTAELVLVASNVASDVTVLAHDGGTWHVVDLPEGANVVAPTNEDDEFAFPIGLAVARVPSAVAGMLTNPVVVLYTTDGSLSLFGVERDDAPEKLQLPVLTELEETEAAPSSSLSPTTPMPTVQNVGLPFAPATGALPPRPVRRVAAGDDETDSEGSSEPELADDDEDDEPTLTTASLADEESPFAATPLFGGQPSFSYTPSTVSTTDGAAASGIGMSSAANAGSSGQSVSNDSTSTTPVFGVTPSKLGPPTSSDEGKSAAADNTKLDSAGGTFGSGGSIPTFGSGANAPVFGSGTSFAGIGQTVPGSAAPASIGAAVSQSATALSSPFDIFGKSSITNTDWSKPLWSPPSKSEAAPSGNTPASVPVALAPTPLAATTASKEDENAGADFSNTPLTPLSSDEIRAAKVFDGVDSDNLGVLQSSQLEALFDELGEGLYGAELAKQLAAMDPAATGQISKEAFVKWYGSFVAADSEDDSNNSSDDTEKREERQKAESTFDELAVNGAVAEHQWESLIEKLGTTYGDEHRRKLKKIAGNGTLGRRTFVDWYLGWLFDGLDDESSEGSGTDAVDTAAKESGNSAVSGNLGEMFKPEAGTWKCDVCLVSNKADAVQCASCTTLKPGVVSQGAAPTLAAAAASGTMASADESSFTALSTTQPSSAGASASESFSFGFSPAPLPGVQANAPAPPSTNVFSFSAKSAPATATSNDALAPTPGISFGFPSAGAMQSPGPAPKATAHAESTALSLEEQRAGKAFDAVDADKKGVLPGTKLEDLLDELGEGLHGPELAKQLLAMDPTSTGLISKEAFSKWYREFVSAEDGSDVDDSSDDNERGEERAKAESAFDDVAVDGMVPEEMWETLIERLGTTYGNEHRHKLKKIAFEGKLGRRMFIDWYLGWLFDGLDDESIEDSGGSAEDAGAEDGGSGAAGNLGDIFKSEPGSWKCEVCLVSNKADAIQCASCTTPQPGASQNIASTPVGLAASSATTSVAGFSFSAKSARPSSTTTTPAPSGVVSFGFSHRATPQAASAAAAPLNTGFNFTAKSAQPAATEDVPTRQEASAKSGAETASRAPFPPTSSHAPTLSGGSKPAAASIAAHPKTSPELAGGAPFPPMSSQAPKLFAEKKSAAASDAIPTKSSTTTVGGATFPPMSSQAPTLFGGSKSSPAIGAAPSKSNSGSSGGAPFPPMSSQAPTQFGASKPAAVSGAPPSKTSFGSGGSASFPPMSAQAPKLFGDSKPAVASSASAPKPSARSPGSSPFPSVPSQAHTMSAAVPPKSNPASATSSVPFPPMSSQAPSLFTSTSASGASTTKFSTVAAQGAAFPPMPSQAPRLFGDSKPATTSSATSLRSNALPAGFPPMSSQAPALFGGSKDAAAGPPASSAGSSGRVRFPPIASQAPTFLGASKSNAASKAPLPTSSGGPERQTGNRAASPQVSAAAVALRNLVEQMNERLSRVRFLDSKMQDPRLQQELDALSSDIRRMIVAVSNVSRTVVEWRTRISLIGSANVDASQSIRAAKSFLHNQDIESTSAAGIGAQAEQLRRHLHTMALAYCDVRDFIAATTDSVANLQSDDGAFVLLRELLSVYDESKRLQEAMSYKCTRMPTHLQLSAVRDLSVPRRPGPPVVDRKQMVAEFWGRVEMSMNRLDEAARSSFHLDVVPKLHREKPHNNPKWRERTRGSALTFKSPITESNDGSLYPPSQESVVRSAWNDYPSSKRQAYKGPTQLRTTTLHESSRESLRSYNINPEDLTQASLRSENATKVGTFPGRRQSIEAQPSVDTAATALISEQNSNDTDTRQLPRAQRDTIEKTDDLGAELAGLSPWESTQKVPHQDGPDFAALLRQFYDKHNPTKVKDVERTLQLYKGKEREMFAKLANKYNVSSPLDKPGNAVSSTESGLSTQLEFGKANDPQGYFSESSPTQGRSSVTQPSTSTGQNPFTSAAPLSDFSSPNAFSAKPAAGFNSANAATAPAPTATSGETRFAGRTARDVLTEVYRVYNPSKIAEVDKLLAKYVGREAQMLINLAAKYKLDPAALGVTSGTAVPPLGSPAPSTMGSPGFGQTSNLGASRFGGSSAGSRTNFGQFASPPANSGFGVAAASGGFGGASFGALAQSPGAFGGASVGQAPAAPFGSPTPFGAPRR